MSMFQLTEYLLWKSIRQKNPGNALVKHENHDIKEEVFSGDMICRVCTNAADIPVTDRINNILIMSAIRTVANISINEADYYPKFVCESCLEELKIALKFKRKCEASDIMFRKAVSSERFIATSSQPLVMHDFELILHQMKLRREASQNVPIKNDESNNDDFDNRENNNYSPVESDNREGTERIVTRRRKIRIITDESNNDDSDNRENNYSPVDSENIKGTEGIVIRRRKIRKITNESNNDDSNNDDSVNRENPYSPEHSDNKKGTESIVTRRRKIRKIESVEKRKTSKTKNNVNIRIMKILKTTKLKIRKTIASSIDEESPAKVKKIRELKCRRCDVKFDTKDEMKEHKSQNSCIYHPCPLCGKLVLNLAQHKNIVHLRPNKYTCHQCGKIYYSSGGLANHLQVHKETFEYSCDLCPYKGKRKSYLVCHMRIHTGEHRYLCSKCPAKFTNPSNLRKHQLMHVGKKFECSKCKKLFRQQKVMEEHYDSAHLNIRYRCTICGRDLSTRKKLLSHELRVHKREKHKLFQDLQKIVISNENE